MDNGNRMKTLMKRYWKSGVLQMYTQEAILSAFRGATCQELHNVLGLTKLSTRIVAKVKREFCLCTPLRHLGTLRYSATHS
jgi:hypothetical protein